MRISLIALALLMSGIAAGAAKADTYRWCAVYGAGEDDFENCYFVTLDQCRAAVSGNGGFCMPNPRYTGPRANPPRRNRPAG